MFSPILLSAHNPGPMTGRGNNTYLIAAANGPAALIDAGTGERRHLEELGAALAAAHARLTHVLVTHGHHDHSDGAVPLARAHPAAALHKYPGARDRDQPVPWQPLGDGDVIVTAGDERLIVLHTPGHAPDHVAFLHEASGTMFTGDLVTLGSSVMIDISGGGDLRQYLASLERVRALAPARLLPAHGPIVTDPHVVLTAYLDHRRMREGQVIEALRAGRSDVPAIAESIYDDLDPALMPAAHQNVRAHLDKLKADGLATDTGGWRLR